MIRRLWLLFSQTVTVIGGVLFVLAATGIADPIPGIFQSADFSRAVDRAAPAVVTIFAQHSYPGEHTEQTGSDWNASPESERSALGSGVIIDDRGFILTNYHVIAAIPKLCLTLPDGRFFDAVIVGTDIETDLALLKVDAVNLPHVVFGDSRKLHVGEPALAIGNPFDVGQTVTSGIISALGRHGLGLNNYEDFIQTDAAINQGNSGGALINSKGELIGINTAIFSPQHSDGFVGIGFAIPTTIINRVLPSLKKGETVERGFFGFIPKQLSKQFAQDLGLSRSSGIMVGRLVSDAPFAKAGIRPFDIILSINNETVLTVNELLQLAASFKPGETVPVTVLRNKKELTFTVTAGTRPKDAVDLSDIEYE